MPRERIHHGKMCVYLPSDDTDTTGYPLQARVYTEWTPELGKELGPDAEMFTEPSLDISWTREPAGYVQTSICFSRERWIEIGKMLEDDHLVSEYSIYTDVLSRDEINNMIRVLKRARDQAYGADE